MLTTLAVTRPILLYVVELRRVRLCASLNMDACLSRSGANRPAQIPRFANEARSG